MIHCYTLIYDSPNYNPQFSRRRPASQGVQHTCSSPSVAFSMTAKATLWINQLPFTATKEEIATHFAKAAGLSSTELLPSVRVIEKNGKFNGTAFVDMSDWKSVDRCLALHQSTFRSGDGSNRRINVREAVDKTQLVKLADRSKAGRNQVLRKAFTGKTKAAPLPDSDDDAPDGDGEGSDGEESDGEGSDGEEKDHNGEVDPQRKMKQYEQEYIESRWGDELMPMPRTAYIYPDPRIDYLRDVCVRRERQDMTVECTDCMLDFVFTVVEQALTCRNRCMCGSHLHPCSGSSLFA